MSIFKIAHRLVHRGDSLGSISKGILLLVKLLYEIAWLIGSNRLIHTLLRINCAFNVHQAQVKGSYVTNIKNGWHPKADFCGFKEKVCHRRFRIGMANTFSGGSGKTFLRFVARCTRSIAFRIRADEYVVALF